MSIEAAKQVFINLARRLAKPGSVSVPSSEGFHRDRHIRTRREVLGGLGLASLALVKLANPGAARAQDIPTDPVPEVTSDGAGDPPPSVSDVGPSVIEAQPSDISAVNPDTSKPGAPTRLSADSMAIEPAEGAKKTPEESSDATSVRLIYDREAGSQDPEVYVRADRMMQDLLTDGEEAGGVFAKAAVWLKAHNLNTSTNVTSAVMIPGGQIGYGSVFSLQALSESDIKDIIKVNPAYEPLLSQRFFYFRDVIDRTSEKTGRQYRVLVHYIAINTNKSDTFNASDLVDLAMMVSKIPGFDKKLAQIGSARITDIPTIKTELNDLNFQNQLQDSAERAIYPDLDRLITTEGNERWRLSPETQRQLSAWRDSRNPGKR